MDDYNPESGKQIMRGFEHKPTRDYEKIAAAIKAEAMEAGNAEHNMTVLHAVQAFIMSCTILGRGHN
jgi:hypothetical protein